MLLVMQNTNGHCYFQGFMRHLDTLVGGSYYLYISEILTSISLTIGPNLPKNDVIIAVNWTGKNRNILNALF